jgi:hypothetical protein
VVYGKEELQGVEKNRVPVVDSRKAYVPLLLV